MKNELKVEAIKNLREETGAGIADSKSALEQALETVKSLKLTKAQKASYMRDAALEILKQKGFDKAASKEGREVKAGLVETYSHGGKVGVLVELLCETDFVAKTDDFKNLTHELALQIASMKPDSVDELLSQEYIRDESLTIDQLIKSVVSKVGENIQVGRFERIAIGD